MIGLISITSLNGVIGKENKLPFSYKEDMKFFRETTLDSVVIMGRNTFESMNSKPLPRRENIVVSSRKISGIVTKPTLSIAIEEAKKFQKNIWLIGGASIYEEGMLYADVIYLTQTPDIIKGDNLIKFPWINPSLFEIRESGFLNPENLDCQLILTKYFRDPKFGLKTILEKNNDI